MNKDAQTPLIDPEKSHGAAVYGMDKLAAAEQILADPKVCSPKTILGAILLKCEFFRPPHPPEPPRTRTAEQEANVQSWINRAAKLGLIDTRAPTIALDADPNASDHLPPPLPEESHGD